MRVAVVSLSDPNGPSTGGSARIRGIISSVEAAGAEAVPVFPPAPVTTGQQSSSHGMSASLGERHLPFGVRDLKREFLPMPLALAGRNQEIVARLAQIDPDVQVITSVGQRSLLSAGRRSTWVDFSDLWSDLTYREAESRKGLAKLTVSMQGRQLRGVERGIYESASAVTVAGRKDWDAMQAKGISCFWLPHPVAAEMVRRVSVPGTRTMGFLANFHYWPNQDAYEILIKDWLPKLRAMGWRLIVAGVNSESVRAGAPEGVEVLGQLDSLDAYYAQIDVTAAPIRLGGGMKVKVVESLAKGVPVVSSIHGIEGLGVDRIDGVAVVDLEDPDFGDLDALAHQSGDPEFFEPYTFRAFDRTIADVLASISARS